MKTKILVTGGAGFIGSHIVDYLLYSNYFNNIEYDVMIIDDLSSGQIHNIEHHKNNPNFYFENISIQSKELESIFKSFKPETVFHLAAIPGVSASILDPEKTNEVNVQGTVNLLNLSKNNEVRRFIFSSSSSVYGGAESLPTTEDVELQPKSPYALQKKIGEEYCRMFSNMYNLDTVCLRYFNVFGERQMGTSPYAAVISSFAEAIKNNTNPIIYGDGNQFRDFCHVDNIVMANILAATSKDKFSGDVFNIGCGGRITINELASKMNTLPPVYNSSRAGDVRQSQASIDKAQSGLMYEVVTSFDDGLQKTLKYYLNQ